MTEGELSGLAAGLAGGIAGGDTAGAVAGAQAGKTSLENNALGCAGSSNPYCVGKNDLLTTGGGGPGPVAGGVGAAGALATGGDKDGEAQPNVGKDLTDEQKKVLGGTGSGTPGGWGPEDEEGARNNETGQKPTAGKQVGKWSVDELSDGAKNIDPASKKGDLTLAGRALQKHGSREGSAFPSAKGNPASINEQGQKIVDSILNDPNKSIIQSNTGRYGQVTDVISPSGRGLRYDAQGKLIGFLEPPIK